MFPCVPTCWVDPSPGHRSRSLPAPLCGAYVPSKAAPDSCRSHCRPRSFPWRALCSWSTRHVLSGSFHLCLWAVSTLLCACLLLCCSLMLHSKYQCLDTRSYQGELLKLGPHPYQFFLLGMYAAFSRWIPVIWLAKLWEVHTQLSNVNGRVYTPTTMYRRPVFSSFVYLFVYKFQNVYRSVYQVIVCIRNDKCCGWEDGSVGKI